MTQSMPFRFRILSNVVLLLFVAVVSSNAQTKTMTLEDCIAIALENNTALKTSAFSYEVAKQDKLGSYRGILPRVSTSAGRGKVETGPSEYLSDEPVGIDPETGNVIYEERTRKIERSIRESSSANVTISQNLFDGGIWWNQIRKADADKRASYYDYISQRDNTILSVQQAFFDYVKQMKLLEVDSIAVDRSRKQLERSQTMFELGATAQVDVYRSRVNLGNDRIAFLQQKNIVAQARKQLNIAMGRDPFTPINIKYEQLDLYEQLPRMNELVEQAYENQPLIKKFNADVKSRKLAVSLAKGVNYPTVSTYVNYDRFHEDAVKVFSDFGQNYQLRYGINVSFDIFNGFSDYVNIQKAEINYKSTRENKEDYKRQLKSDIHQRYADYKSYLDIIDINEVNLKAAREEFRLANERYQVGAGTALEVRESQVNLTQAEQTLIAAKFNARLVLAQLDNYLGKTYKNYSE
ncbi:MAG: hypothetical protein GF313_06170 [Caldithrix sp.]|nr:hypothetical protein [Caldithrix sp.]